MTLIIIRHISNMLLWGLRALKTTSVAPIGNIPSSFLAHTGCESTWLSKFTFVTGFGMRTKIVSWFFGFTIVISSWHFIVGRTWVVSCCWWLWWCCSCCCCCVNWTLAELTGMHSSSALGCHLRWLLHIATLLPAALYPLGQWRKHRSPANVSAYMQFVGNIVPYFGFARRGQARAVKIFSVKNNSSAHLSESF